MPCIVDDDVEASAIRNDLGNSSLYGSFGLNVQLDGAQIDAMFGAISS